MSNRNPSENNLFQRYFDQLAPHLPKGKEFKKNELEREVDRLDVDQSVKYVVHSYCYNRAVREEGGVRVA